MRLLNEQGARMALERRLLEEHARATAGLTVQSWSATPSGELCVNFELKLVKGVFAGVLVYPELFPDVPAFVRPQKSGESWSGHQYRGSGVLCLQYGPDNWHRDITGVDLVQSACALIWGEILHGLVPDFGPVPSRHRASDAHRLSANDERLIVTRSLRELLTGPGRNTPVQIQAVVDWLRGESVAVVLQAGDPLVALGDVPDVLSQGPGIQVPGVAVPVPSAGVLNSAKNAQDLQSCLGAAWPWDEGLAEKLQFLIAHDEDGQLYALLLKGGSTPIFQRYHVADFSADEPQRLPETFSKLSGASVAIVGMGSLGSKIAVSLARAGVRNFVLVDDDVVGPHNLVRNELNWHDVGFSKLAAGTRALKLVAPGALVTAWPMKIAEQANPSVSAMVANAVVSCTLVVDATANPSAFLALAAITKRAGQAMVWGEVFGGGGGGLMARSRPGVDTDALGVRTHLYGVMKEMAPAPKGREANYGIESEEKVYVASDADVGSLAASMTQFCLDTLCAEPSEYPAAAYLIGFRKFWEFRCPFDVIPVTCPGAAPQEPQTLSEQDQQEVAAIRRLIDEGASAANYSAS
ncbi:ThiF family adenylyltransferase [Acidovorax sacchari]|uniref:ThiF family adenylyltransferase n=1 Tax=Acidovorax sacchari TaxID=3230736 RepID=UPI0039E2FC23